MSQVTFAASKESSTESYMDITNCRHDLLINLITRARELELSSTIRELLIDYLQVDILSHHLAQDNYNKIISSNRQLKEKIEKLEDKITELEENVKSMDINT